MIKAILDNVIEYSRQKNIKTFKIGLVGAGEPLLYLDTISEIIDHINKSDTDISLYTITNGILFDDAVADYFLKNSEKIHINISCDGPAYINDFCRKTQTGEGTFQRTMDAIKKYYEYFGKMPRINCTVHKKAIQNSSDLFDFFMRNGMTDISFSKYVGNDAKHSITWNEYDGFIKSAKEFGFTVRQCEPRRTYDCAIYGTECGVGINNIYYADGNAYPCARFTNNLKYIIGNHLTSLDEIAENMKKFEHNNKYRCYFDAFES
jgi:uncharacterized protein